MADARRLMGVGFAGPLAQELAAQINAGVGNARRLIELGMVPLLAALVASAISGLSVSPGKLAELGMVVAQIIEFLKQLGGSIPFGALTFSDGTPLHFSDGTYLELAA